LRQAGHEGLSVEVVTSPQDTGMVEGATIFAQNAKAGGVNVTVKNVDGGTIYGPQYLQWPFSADYWGTRNYLQQVASVVLKGAAFNETHWDAHPNYAKFARLYRQATSTVNPKKRAELIREMQRMEYDDGGLIIWGFKNLTDGYSARVGGYKVDRGTLNLNKYGNGFRTIYFV
jgi:peptide/nickel transport system substrate-binding protein